MERADPTLIFTVTTLHFEHPRLSATKRCVGWYPDLAGAEQCLRENYGDIHETAFEYAVIEQTEPGLYPFPIEHWFRWAGSGYEPSTKPDDLVGMRGFAIG